MEVKSPFSIRLRTVAPPASNPIPLPSIRAEVVAICLVLVAALYASRAFAQRYALRPSIAALIPAVAIPAVTTPAAIAIASIAIIHPISVDISHDLSDILKVFAPIIS